jgi:hypothetical protein
MLTLFAIAKPFDGHIGVIQRNAIGAWTRLGHGCEVLLFGDEPGTAEVAREYGMRHVPGVARNRRGTPLVSDLFAQAMRLASHPVLVYANADMILTGDLPAAVMRVRERGRFLLCGQRWNLSLDAPLDFAAVGGSPTRRSAARQRSRSPAPSTTSLSARPVRRRSVHGGRAEWDQWLLFHARTLGAALIDATASVLAVHQATTTLTSEAPRAEIEREIDDNRALALFHRLDLRDATHLLTAGGVRRTRPKASDPASPRCPSSISRQHRRCARYRFWRRRVRGLPVQGGLAT